MMVATDPGDDFLDLVNAYRQKFNDLPDLFMLKAPSEKVKAALKKAISNGKPFTAQEWETEMNIKRPLPGNLT